MTKTQIQKIITLLEKLEIGYDAYETVLFVYPVGLDLKICLQDSEYSKVTRLIKKLVSLNK